jgi:hypothetical protein
MTTGHFEKTFKIIKLMAKKPLRLRRMLAEKQLLRDEVVVAQCYLQYKKYLQDPLYRNCGF